MGANQTIKVNKSNDIYMQDALDALNGRTFDGRDMRISIDEGRPGGPRGGGDRRGGGRGGDRDGGRDRRRDRSRSRSGGRRERSRSGGRRDRSDSPPARRRRSPSSKYFKKLKFLTKEVKGKEHSLKLPSIY